jgi:NTP pyrophosphatase (non-canonical NTP hydrolase)
LITIKQILAQVDELRAAQAWTSTTPEQQLVHLAYEVDEVAQELHRLHKAYESHNEQEIEAIRGQLGMELYDVIWNACAIGALAGVDLEQCIERKVAINRSRTWGAPVTNGDGC